MGITDVLADWCLSSSCSENAKVIFHFRNIKIQNNIIFSPPFFCRPKINSDVMIEVQSTTNLRHLSYQVLGRGDIIIAKSLDIPNLSTYTFSFLASFAMVPKAQVVIHYINDDEIISDHLQIDFDDDLQNFVSTLRQYVVSHSGEITKNNNNNTYNLFLFEL